MNEQIRESWDQLQDSVSAVQNASALTMAVYLLLGGVLSLYLRVLYTRCSGSVSDTDSVTRIFPLLTIVTTAVIAVVKSSLALSLGMVGALSIVRFRAAIKEPEELVFLFLCIAVGLSLGAAQPLLAVTLVLVATVFVVGMHVSTRKRRSENIMLTITGDADPHFSDEKTGVLAALNQISGRFSVQRFDVEAGRGQVRIALRNLSAAETTSLVLRLREQLPGCEFSYVNMNSLM